jgi:hypothetical protein
LPQFIESIEDQNPVVQILESPKQELRKYSYIAHNTIINCICQKENTQKTLIHPLVFCAGAHKSINLVPKNLYKKPFIAKQPNANWKTNEKNRRSSLNHHRETQTSKINLFSFLFF